MEFTEQGLADSLDTGIAALAEHFTGFSLDGKDHSNDPSYAGSQKLLQFADVVLQASGVAGNVTTLSGISKHISEGSETITLYRGVDEFAGDAFAYLMV